MDALASKALRAVFKLHPKDLDVDDQIKRM
jgi:hypothetical protein